MEPQSQLRGKKSFGFKDQVPINQHEEILVYLLFIPSQTRYPVLKTGLFQLKNG